MCCSSARSRRVQLGHAVSAYDLGLDLTPLFKACLWACRSLTGQRKFDASFFNTSLVT